MKTFLERRKIEGEDLGVKEFLALISGLRLHSSRKSFEVKSEVTREGRTHWRLLISEKMASHAYKGSFNYCGDIGGIETINEPLSSMARLSLSDVRPQKKALRESGPRREKIILKDRIV